MLLRAQPPDSLTASPSPRPLGEIEGGPIRRTIDAATTGLIALLVAPALLLVPAQAWERFSDQADEVWEPFLLDD